MWSKLSKKKNKPIFSVKEKIGIEDIGEYDSITGQNLVNIIRAKTHTDLKEIPFWLKLGMQRRFNIAAALHIAALNEIDNLTKQLKNVERIMENRIKSISENNIQDKSLEGLFKKNNTPFSTNGTIDKGLEHSKLSKKSLKKFKELNIEKQREIIMKLSYTLKSRILKIENKVRANISSCLSGQIYHGAIFYTTPIEKVSPNDVIIVRNLNKKVATKKEVIQILRNVNFDVKKGEMVAIMGRSGSGKTTLLNIIAGLDHATTGDVLFSGANLTYLTNQQKMKFRKKHVAMIFQDNNLLNNISAMSNARIGVGFAKKKIRKKDIYEIFEVLGLKGLEKKKPPMLSGGQQQRVAIARALLKQPEILFCDEPTAALDKDIGQGIMDLLKKIQQKFDTTIVIVTHHPNIARQATRIIEIEQGELVKSKIRTYIEENANPFIAYKKEGNGKIFWIDLLKEGEVIKDNSEYNIELIRDIFLNKGIWQDKGIGYEWT